MGSRKITADVSVFVTKGISPRKSGLWNDALVVRTTPLHVVLRSYHGIKPITTFIKFQRFSFGPIWSWRPPLVKIFCFRPRCPNQFQRSIKRSFYIDFIIFLVHAEVKKNCLVHFLLSLSFFNTSSSWSKRLARSCLYCSSHFSISFILLAFK